MSWTRVAGEHGDSELKVFSVPEQYGNVGLYFSGLGRLE